MYRRSVYGKYFVNFNWNNVYNIWNSIIYRKNKNNEKWIKN